MTRFLLSLLVAASLSSATPAIALAADAPSAKSDKSDGGDPHNGRNAHKNDDGSQTCHREPCPTSGDAKPTPPLRDGEGNGEPKPSEG